MGELSPWRQPPSLPPLHQHLRPLHLWLPPPFLTARRLARYGNRIRTRRVREGEKLGGGRWRTKQSVFHCVHEQEASIINLDNDSLLPTLLPLSLSLSLYYSILSRKRHSPSFKLLRKTIAYIERNVEFQRRKQLLTETKVRPSVFINNFPTT